MLAIVMMRSNTSYIQSLQLGLAPEVQFGWKPGWETSLEGFPFSHPKSFLDSHEEDILPQDAPYKLFI